MDNVSYRNNRPAPQRSESTPTPAPQPAAPAPSTHHERARHSQHPKSPKRKFVLAGIILAVVLLALAGWFLFGRTSTASTIDSSKYQAVFFTNGQVYFGKLTAVNGEYMRLNNVYYLQNKTEKTEDATPQSANAQDSSDVELIKLGNEIHGPEDEMLIAKEQVLFFENLKPAGTVSQTITNFQKDKQ